MRPLKRNCLKAILCSSHTIIVGVADRNGIDLRKKVGNKLLHNRFSIGFGARTNEVS